MSLVKCFAAVKFKNVCILNGLYARDVPALRYPISM